MQLTNLQIYQAAEQLTKAFMDSDIYMSAKVNFYIQKNMDTLNAAAAEIEQMRLKIAKCYGTLNEEQNQYIIPHDQVENAEKEVQELLEIVQDLNIKTITLDDLGNIELTPKQMQALMFMIEE